MILFALFERFEVNKEERRSPPVWQTLVPPRMVLRRTVVLKVSDHLNDSGNDCNPNKVKGLK